MKIGLISTTSIYALGLRTISSVLRKEGYEVSKIFVFQRKPYCYKPYTTEELEKINLLCEDCDLIGIDSFSSCSYATQIINYLKGKGKLIVWGGVHATMSPEECIDICDIVCVGEAEEVILDLVNAIEEDKPINNISNLWIRKDEEIIKNKIRKPIENLDEIPFPDYELENSFILKDGNFEKLSEDDFNDELFFMTGRGCPRSCNYCCNNLFNKLYKTTNTSILRWHSIDYVIRGLSHLRNMFQNIKSFYICDDSFALRKVSDIEDFSKRYKEEVNIKFRCMSDPHVVTDEKINLLVDAGCYMISIGIQGSERVNREIYKRQVQDKDILHCARILNKYSKVLHPSYEIINCNPYEEKEDLINLINLIRKIPKPYSLSVSGLSFFPKTDLSIKALGDGIIDDSDFNYDYGDRTKCLLKRKDNNLYLNLILSLMRGVCADNKIGLIKNSWFEFLLDEKRVNKNLENIFFVILFIKLLKAYDVIKLSQPLNNLRVRRITLKNKDLFEAGR